MYVNIMALIFYPLKSMMAEYVLSKNDGEEDTNLQQLAEITILNHGTWRKQNGWAAIIVSLTEQK